MTSNSQHAISSSNKVVLKRKKSSLCELKIAVIGDRNVGKTAIVVRFLTKRFIMEYEHGMDNKYRHEVMMDNEPVMIDLLDISSNTSLNNFDVSSNLPDLILLVYSITERQSFNFIRNFLKSLAQLKAISSSSSIPLVAIVGNKSDLVHLRQVSVEEGEILTSEYSELTAFYYGEVSAADQHVSQLFVDLYRWVKKNKTVTKLTPSLLDRVVIGIKGSSNNNNNNNNNGNNN